jgi:hypothetical protein
MKKLMQLIVTFFKKAKQIIPVLMLLLGCYAATAQVRTTMLGAMNALNSGSVATTPPASPAVIAAISPAVIPVSNNPIVGTGAGVSAASNAMTVIDMLNAKDLNLSYQSAYSWWTGYQDYRNAAAGISFNANGLVELGDYGVYVQASSDLRSAVNFFMEDTHFILFRDFAAKNVTLVVHGNQPIPVELMPDAGGFITYKPMLTSFTISVPLDLK